MEMQTRSATFQPASYNAERGTVEAIISTGSDIVRRDYQGEYKERLNMNPSAWTAARDTVPVLKDHRREVDSLIGVADSIRIDNGRALASVRLSDRADMAGIRRDIETGILNSLSLGYVVPKWREFSENGTRVREAEQVVVHEISFTPLAADPAAKTRSEVNMNEELQTQIRGIAVAVGVQPAFADGLIQRNATIEEARTEIIREAARNAPAIDGRAPTITTRDAGDGIITRLADGLLSRIDPRHKPEAGREFAYFRISDIARRCLQERGLSTLGSPVEILTRAMHTTSDFSAVLSEVYNKSLLTLRTSPSAIQQLFRRATAADFRARHIMQISDGPALALVPETGEVTFGTITDSELASYAVKSYARAFSISFQALVNDNMQALSDIAEKMTRGARSWFTGFLASTIMANPALADTKAVFHTDHLNLAASGAAPSDSTVAAGRLAMRLQTDASGNPIDAPAKFIVIPAALETTVDKLLATLYPTSSSEAETSARGLTPVVVPQFDAAGADAAWYLFASPSDAPVFEVSEISGYEGPRVETRQGFTTLGTEVRVVWYVGAGAVDSRGAYMNAGE